MSRLKAFSTPGLTSETPRRLPKISLRREKVSFSLVVGNGRKASLEGEKERRRRERERRKGRKGYWERGRESPRECTVFIYDRRKIQAFFDHAGGRFPLIK